VRREAKHLWSRRTPYRYPLNQTCRGISTAAQPFIIPPPYTVPITLNPETRKVLTDRIRYYRELGIYDLYRRGSAASAVGSAAIESEAIEIAATATPLVQSELREEMSPRKSAAVRVSEEDVPSILLSWPEQRVTDPVAALKIIREDLGDCTRCKLARTRTNIVFGVGDPNAELMFVGEGPGADEDAKGEPFVGRAGQLLNNMIRAMGIQREDVYIANVVKCRPPGNRQPERDETETCSPFLMRQIAAIKPKVIVALGATAAKNLLAMSASMMELRGRFYDFMPTGVRSNDSSWLGAKLAVTYHPAFLLRDPRQKGEAWKDLQMVMKFLGLEPPKKTTEQS
jgi:uracil-DNA glycosylase family 4